MIVELIHGTIAPMLCTRPFYHVLSVAVLIAGWAWVGPAAAGELSYACEGTTITLSCQDGADTGNCLTQTASDPAWNVTCRGHDEGNGRFKMDCRNATAVGGTPVEITFAGSQLGTQLAEAVGDSTGTTCTQTQ